MDDYGQDIDGVDGRGFVAWLIYTGASGMVGWTPWSFTHAFFTAIDDYSRPQPVADFDGFGDLFAAELMIGLMPLIITISVAGACSMLVVLAARAGHRLHPLVLLALGAIAGGLTAAVAGSGGIDELIFGIVSGLASGGAIALIRKATIRGG